MRTDEFDFELPPGLIAQAPLPRRSDARLLCLSRTDQALTDRHVRDIPALLREDDVLVFNDTKVIPARLFALKDTGGQIEIMLERVLSEHNILVQIRASKAPKPGMRLWLQPDGPPLRVLGRDGELYRLESGQPITELLERYGHMPLPPYIQRTAEVFDRERYQTVFASKPGAVAAPTAGLHFDDALLQALRRRGIEWAHITLHVGMGTFAPLRGETVETHVMHRERMEVDAATLAQLHLWRSQHRRLVAVGTTSARCLESLPDPWPEQAVAMETGIFIYPGYRFRNVDAMITNFHLPRSTLLMLVCAFAGKEFTLTAYRHAVAKAYRFFSYGDAMFIE